MSDIRQFLNRRYARRLYFFEDEYRQIKIRAHEAGYNADISSLEHFVLDQLGIQAEQTAKGRQADE